MTYIYIHGFGGSGKGSKAQLLRDHFGDALVAPSLSSIPELAVDTLAQIIEQLTKTEPVILIGSSLGGYYAIHLSERYGLKAVLINPSVRPYETLQRVVGEAFSYYDLSRYEWNERHIAMLRQFDTSTVTSNNYLVLLQTGDELLDYTHAAEKFAHSNVIIDEGGNHSYEGISQKFDIIEQFST